MKLLGCFCIIFKALKAPDLMYFTEEEEEEKKGWEQHETNDRIVIFVELSL